MNIKRLSFILVLVTLVLAAGILPLSAAPQENAVHVVKPGETLSGIAAYYGMNMWTLASYNGIANPNLIYVGQRLIIPTSGSTVQSSGTVHVVQPGETLTAIGLRYGVDPWTVARANGISNLNHIYVGQRLVIPTSTTSITSPKPAQPSLPATYPGPWTGEYFDNVSLTTAPYLTRQDEGVNFNWGWGPPAGGMPTNNFSVRWTGMFHFDAGTYRFYTQVDDGVRVYVDGELIIDGWRDGGLRTYKVDRSLPAGNHTIQVDYYDRIQVARIHFWFVKLSGPQPTPTPGPGIGIGSTPTGSWYGEYYNGEGLSGAPVLTRYDPSIGFNWRTDSPAPEVWRDHFSIRWAQTVPLETRNYRFCAWTDDGVRLWVNNNLMINEWHDSNGLTYCSPYAASRGNHVVKVEYYEHQGNALIYVWWEPE